MAIRRLNYTRRGRLTREQVRITLHDTRGGSSFDAVLDLGKERFPADARVFVEAYHRTASMRFDFGRVGHLEPPANRLLSEFSDPSAVLFRVKVTAASGRIGMLLGEADKLHPAANDDRDEQRVPLLPVVAEDLGEEIWRVSFDDSGTTLLVNKRLTNWSEFVRTPLFRATVFPAATRAILVRITRIEEIMSPDDDEDWRSRWIRFATSLPGSGPVDQNNLDEWVEDAVAAFARHNRLLKAIPTSEEA